MEDAVSQLLENRDDISQYGIARFFTEYFNSVRQGTHILFREFSFIQATPHNRASFLRTFWRCFRTVGKNGDLLTAKEYHCLLQLLCPDFPMELTQKAARIVLMDDAMDCLMSFSDFLFAFQIQFYYSEFLESIAAIYQDLLTGKNPNTVIVPTSSSGQHRSRQAPSECSPLDGVEASLFYQCLESLCDRSKYSCPPSALVKEVLSSVQRLTFYGFLMALAKHHGINRAIDYLRFRDFPFPLLPAPVGTLPTYLPTTPPKSAPLGNLTTARKWIRRVMAPLMKQTPLRTNPPQGSRQSDGDVGEQHLIPDAER
ncbi:centriolar satellite-associated tubulin polyglutamylase complex regulator 1 isoform X2 [Emydura macquarii macquarii]|uniref:centriolar satellite-associated tubulin polyglutamylase complex regulator 1 isoform X2 n=1 Tax=Emydura macquarii macquarii TaxID=1129001 RepID=UPI003529D639